LLNFLKGVAVKDRILTKMEQAYLFWD